MRPLLACRGAQKGPTRALQHATALPVSVRANRPGIGCRFCVAEPAPPRVAPGRGTPVSRIGALRWMPIDQS